MKLTAVSTGDFYLYCAFGNLGGSGGLGGGIAEECFALNGGFGDVGRVGQVRQAGQISLY